jgi:hypothetical protein
MMKWNCGQSLGAFTMSSGLPFCRVLSGPPGNDRLACSPLCTQMLKNPGCCLIMGLFALMTAQVGQAITSSSSRHCTLFTLSHFCPGANLLPDAKCVPTCNGVC